MSGRESLAKNYNRNKICTCLNLSAAVASVVAVFRARQKNAAFCFHWCWHRANELFVMRFTRPFCRQPQYLSPTWRRAGAAAAANFLSVVRQYSRTTGQRRCQPTGRPTDTRRPTTLVSQIYAGMAREIAAVADATAGALPPPPPSLQRRMRQSNDFSDSWLTNGRRFHFASHPPRAVRFVDWLLYNEKRLANGALTDCTDITTSLTDVLRD